MDDDDRFLRMYVSHDYLSTGKEDSILLCYLLWTFYHRPVFYPHVSKPEPLYLYFLSSHGTLGNDYSDRKNEGRLSYHIFLHGSLRNDAIYLRYIYRLKKDG